VKVKKGFTAGAFPVTIPHPEQRGQQLCGDGMTEPSNEPSNRELLDRIIKLEDENAKLRTQLQNFWHGVNCTLDTNLHQFASIWDALWPVVEKVFPRFRDTQDRVNAILPPSDAHPSIDRRPKEYRRS
jgi:hypothetical protein